MDTAKIRGLLEEVGNPHIVFHMEATPEESKTCSICKSHLMNPAEMALRMEGRK